MAIVVVAGLLLAAVGVSAQEQTLTVQLAGLTGDDWPQAQAVVTVLGSDGRTVAGLSETHFQARFDDETVPISAVSRAVDSTLSIAVVLALDVSGSMEGGALEEARLAARRFLDGLGPEDSVAVVAFSDSVRTILNFTQDRAAAAAAIDALMAGGDTALHEATVESIRLAAGEDSGRRAVVLLSDGLDNGSALSRADAVAIARTLGVPVFAIGLGADIDRDYLHELAQASEGQFAETPSPEGLAELYQGVAEFLRGQYVLALDASSLDLPESEAVTLRVDVLAGDGSGSGEREICPQKLCVTLSELEPRELPEKPRTFVAGVISTEPVESVRFLVDGTVDLELTEPPYQFILDPASLETGEHTLAALVATASGETQRKEVTVSVGAAASGGSVSTTLLGVAVVSVIVPGGILVLILVRRRRSDGPEEELELAQRPEPPSGPLVGGLKRRPLWDGEEGPPPVEIEEALGFLHVAGGPLAGDTFPVGSAPVSIGTGHRCLIRLPREYDESYEVAPEHARAWIRDGQLMVHEIRRLTAMGSAGGRWEILAPGDVLTIGPCTFRFELGAGDEPDPGAEEPAQPVPDILRSSAGESHEGSQRNAAADLTAWAPKAEQGQAAPQSTEDGDHPDAGAASPDPLRPQPGE